MTPPFAKIIYLITFHSTTGLRYFIAPYLVFRLPSGEYGKPQAIENLKALPEATITDKDSAIHALLLQENTSVHPDQLSSSLFPLQGKSGATLLPLLLDSGKCYFVSYRKRALQLGKQRQGQLNWVKESNKQRLQCWVSGGANTILPLQPLWYVDHEKHECGLLSVPLDPEIAHHILFSPPFSKEQIQHIYFLLEQSETEKQGHQQLKQYLEDLRQPLTEKHVDHWYYDWQPVQKQQGWFDFEMGISLNGHKINLLPALAELVQNQLSSHTFSELMTFPDEKLFYVSLPKNQKFSISMHRLRKILSVLTELYEEESLLGNEKLRLPKLRALEFNTLPEALTTQNIEWQGNLSAQTLREEFQKLQNHPSLKLPKAFRGQLRAYQQYGVQWLQSLYKLGLGGILADDMGLGKTIQVLVHVLIEKNKKNISHPSLIIAPTSLIANWQQEALQFTPSLRVLVLHGEARHEHHKKIAQYDLILTSYPILIRDAEKLLKNEYHLLILDEGQYIKNVNSKAWQIAKRLQAKQRLCLTGTPIENHLDELWALFHFILPGLLGERRQFQRLFRIPIEKNRDALRQAHLQQRIAPFLLRRTKKEVLQELPEKVEILRPIILTEVQRELYESVRIALHEKVLSVIQERGFQRSQLFILDALLKLRQICCDPRLLKAGDLHYDESASSKLQFLTESLPALIEQGRRILLFSQFSTMLGLIEKTCQAHQLPYLKLTGKTLHREKIIQQFQAGEVPLFLISLKAGGVGLNLTKADTVIHYDPWWNPAVENQATDRAHRIGQEKTVFVYKLITSGTIEEKMITLQNEKKKLIDAILTGSEQTTHTLNFTDIENLFGPLSIR